MMPFAKRDVLNYSQFIKHQLSNGSRNKIYYNKTLNWIKDKSVLLCTSCMLPFDWKIRRHHCRLCGLIFCHECSIYTVSLPGTSINNEKTNFLNSPKPLNLNLPIFEDNEVRVCNQCYNETSLFSISFEKTSEILLSNNNLNYKKVMSSSECHFLRVLAGDYMLENPQFGCIYQLNVIPSNRKLSLAVYNENRQLVGFIDVLISELDSFYKLQNHSSEFSSLCVLPAHLYMRIELKVKQSYNLHSRVFLNRKVTWFYRTILFSIIILPFYLLFDHNYLWIFLLMIILSAWFFYKQDDIINDKNKKNCIELRNIEVIFYPCITEEEALLNDASVRSLHW